MVLLIRAPPIPEDFTCRRTCGGNGATYTGKLITPEGEMEFKCSDVFSSLTRLEGALTFHTHAGLGLFFKKDVSFLEGDQTGAGWVLTLILRLILSSRHTKRKSFLYLLLVLLCFCVLETYRTGWSSHDLAFDRVSPKFLFFHF
ncbi:hypothetical protein SADUNF_Sadunf11G0122500 [Salix dunnii]|uniref:Uncharacterized protein n=1 Tax=Salix dunnii TaxID=1413687 RepID=A0A835JL23_9ROSI|nr:hypothetical protein SADUNF_Sadunf11G0122500 [Salix dunnii]